MRGLLEGDQHWHGTINEATLAKDQVSYKCYLFSMICCIGEVEDIPKLWDKHKAALREDFLHRCSQISGSQYDLAEINTLLKTYCLNLQKVKLPVTSLAIAVSNMAQEVFDIVEEQIKAQINTDKLNAEQD